MGASASPVQEGRVLGGRYRVERRLDRGGMGAVWLARHVTLNSELAVKVIDPSESNTEDERRFMTEAKAAAQLNSPHIVRTFDYGVDEGLPYLVMEFLPGETLAERVRREGRLSPQVTAEFLLQTARGVSHAHDAGVVHRDLKPANIFLVQNEDDVLVKVLDFGIAKLIHTSGMEGVQTQSGAVFGTPHYMSPEQVEGDKQVYKASDVWAFGVMAYECLVGERPFRANSVGGVFLAICSKPLPRPSLKGPVPLGFDQWFARTMQRDPTLRSGSIREVAKELAELCTAGAGREAATWLGPSSSVPRTAPTLTHGPAPEASATLKSPQHAAMVSPGSAALDSVQVKTASPVSSGARGAAVEGTMRWRVAASWILAGMAASVGVMTWMTGSVPSSEPLPPEIQAAQLKAVAASPDAGPFREAAEPHPERESAPTVTSLPSKAKPSSGTKPEPSRQNSARTRRPMPAVTAPGAEKKDKPPLFL